MQNMQQNPAAQQARKRDWTIRDMLDWCTGYLEKHGDADPRGAAQWLVSHATGLEKIELYLNLDRVLNAGELDFMRDAVQRRAKGEPLQYLTGSAPFRFITVEVAPGVLIPRPETEVLVSTFLDMLPAAPKRVATDSYTSEELKRLLASKHADDGEEDAAGAAEGTGDEEQQFAPAFIEAPKPGQRAADDASAAGNSVARAAGAMKAMAHPAATSTSGPAAPMVAASPKVPAADPALHVLEIGTGSGCIACSLASERPDVKVTATDLSPDAVALARRNAQRLHVADRVQVIHCDLGADLPPESLGAFDGLISNPPYIPTAVYEGLDAEVHDYEPQLALDGGPDGLDFFRRLLPFGLQALCPGAPFAVELHEDTLDQAKQLAEQAGYTQVRIVADMAGRPRILAARTPER